MNQDALDRVRPGKMSKEEKRDYAIAKKNEETTTVLNDPAQTKKISQQFRDHVAKERKRLGLD